MGRYIYSRSVRFMHEVSARPMLSKKIHTNLYIYTIYANNRVTSQLQIPRRHSSRSGGTSSSSILSQIGHEQLGGFPDKEDIFRSLLGHLELGFLDKLGVGNCWEILTLKIPAWRPIGSTVRRSQD